MNIRSIRWRHYAFRLKPFAVRFGISLVILGVLYVALFVFGPLSHNKPRSSSQKMLELRTALDQEFIDGVTLAAFNESSAVAGDDLGVVYSHYQTSHEAVQKLLKKSQGDLTPDIKDNFKVVLDRQKLAIDSYNISLKPLSKVISYDPEADLGKLEATNDKLATRAQSAQDGLKKAADNDTAISNSSALSVEGNNGTPLLVEGSTKDLLLKESSCFGALSSAAKSGQADKVSQIRGTCIKDYPALRRQAIKNVLQNSFNSDYQQTMKSDVLPLLKQLDKQIKVLKTNGE